MSFCFNFYLTYSLSCKAVVIANLLQRFTGVPAQPIAQIKYFTLSVS